MYYSFSGGCASHTKKIKGKQKLQSASKTLKRNLEVSYDISVASDEEAPELSQRLQDLQIHESIMNELKEKYITFSNYYLGKFSIFIGVI